LNHEGHEEHEVQDAAKPQQVIEISERIWKACLDLFVPFVVQLRLRRLATFCYILTPC